MRRPQKTCPFCETRVRFVDFKDDRTLGRFITDHGKILPSRLSAGEVKPAKAKKARTAELRSARAARS